LSFERNVNQRHQVCVYNADALEGPRVWGLHGESWNRDLLLDWSFSGFAAKERGYPDPPFAANVLDFGAVGNGDMDCTGAFRAAIDHVSTLGGGTILIPEGRYRLSKRLVLSGDNTVLKGAGPDATILYYDNPLSVIDKVGAFKNHRLSLLRVYFVIRIALSDCVQMLRSILLMDISKVHILGMTASFK
jgi:hypothetical protein